MDAALVLLTLTSYATLAYAYVGYPAFLWLLGTLVGPLPSRTRSLSPDESGGSREWPTVSIIFSALNEEKVIGDRVRNLLTLDYPSDRVEILVGSDGSTDRTPEIVRAIPDRRVRLFPFPHRRGKASVLNDLTAAAQGEVAVFTDANTYFYPDAVRELVRALVREPSACAVVGRVQLPSAKAAGNLDGLYWEYETWVKTRESRFGCVAGANGPIYAIRRKLYHPIPSTAVSNDDLLIPMFLQLSSGGRVLFEPKARAWEGSPPRLRDEFRRHVRIGAGGLQCFLWTWRLLNPRNGMAAFSYLSHRVCRWLSPILILSGFAANLFLLHVPFFRWLFVSQLMASGLALSAPAVRRVPALGLAASGMRYFLAMNAAMLLGFARLVRGQAPPVWNTTARAFDRPPD